MQCAETCTPIYIYKTLKPHRYTSDPMDTAQLGGCYGVTMMTGDHSKSQMNTPKPRIQVVKKSVVIDFII